jgi:hypothetical protein
MESRSGRRLVDEGNDSQKEETNARLHRIYCFRHCYVSAERSPGRCARTADTSTSMVETLLAKTLPLDGRI